MVKIFKSLFDKNKFNQKNRLKTLKAMGFNPQLIIDIGAHRGSWATMAHQVFETANFFLIEANQECVPFLKKAGYPFEIALLGEKEGQMKYYRHFDFENASTGNSTYIENTVAFSKENYQELLLPVKTLDSVLLEHQQGKVDFIKLDVQGAELDILKGAPKSLDQVMGLLLEVQILEYNKNAPFLREVCNELAPLGFDLFDIIELHYLPSGHLVQVDGLFLKKSLPFFKFQ